MKRLAQVDAVIILMSPSYKRKVLRREESVYTEFSSIWSRYELSERARRSGKGLDEIARYFDVIPVLWAGDKESSVPGEVGHLKYVDFTWFRAPIRKGSAQHEHFGRIADTIRAVIELKTTSFRQSYQLYRDLFLELKAGGKSHTPDIITKTFVKTEAYRRVARQDTCFLVGRKGSGKSSVVQGMRLLRGHEYIAHIDIIANDFNIGSVYELINSAKIRADLSLIFSRMACYRFAWEAFLYLSAAAHLVVGHSARREVQLLRQRLRDIFAAGRSVQLESPDALSAYFIHCFNHIPSFVNQCIKDARAEETYFRTDLQALFTRKRFLELVMGVEEVGFFEQLIGENQQRFFVTLDGFDEAFDDFRRSSPLDPTKPGLLDRATFEIQWLTALLIVVNRMRRTPQSENAFHHLLDFCITIPRDRFLEVPKVDRDSYRYHSSYWALNWTGIELTILLRKRLQMLSNGRTDDKASSQQEARLHAVWRRVCRRVPWDIRIPFGSANHDMPLFLYVLRHTFWRPREILMHYAKIVALAREGRGTSPISSDQLRKLVSDTTYEIISSEFLNEFSQTIMTLPAILERFRGKKQFLPFEDLATILEGVEVRLAVDASATGLPLSAEDELMEKLKLLYSIGMLGIEVTTEMRQRFHILHRQAFYFNEGITLFKGVTPREALKACRYIIHPVFTEYLELDNSGAPLTLQYTWQYLHDVENVIKASSGESLF